MSDMDGRTYLDATEETGRAFVMRNLQGPVCMLNLLRFKDTADYSATPELAPDEPIPGAAAYDRYIEVTLPHLHESGGEVLFMGSGEGFLIGPPEMRWDLAMIVRHRDVETFLSFAQNEAYLDGVGHRTAALEDSRLLPLTQHG